MRYFHALQIALLFCVLKEVSVDDFDRTLAFWGAVYWLAHSFVAVLVEVCRILTKRWKGGAAT